MIVAVYLDADTCAVRLGEALVRLGIAAVFGTRELPQGATDDAQLAKASEFGHPIVTGNASDFARLHSRLMNDGRIHPGIIIRIDRARSPEALAAAISRLCADHTSESIANLVHWV